MKAKTRPLYVIECPAGYYALRNTVTGRVIRSGYDVFDHPESFFREKYKAALAKTTNKAKHKDEP